MHAQTLFSTIKSKLNFLLRSELVLSFHNVERTLPAPCRVYLSVKNMLVTCTCHRKIFVIRSKICVTFTEGLTLKIVLKYLTGFEQFDAIDSKIFPNH